LCGVLIMTVRVQRKMKTGNFYRDVNKGISLIIIIT